MLNLEVKINLEDKVSDLKNLKVVFKIKGKKYVEIVRGVDLFIRWG